MARMGKIFILINDNGSLTVNWECKTLSAPEIICGCELVKSMICSGATKTGPLQSFSAKDINDILKTK